MLIKACLNGSRALSEHPALPLTPEALAADSAAVIAAGAGAVHIHPRDATGAQSLVPEVCDAAVAAIRTRCPSVPVGLTTAAWIERDTARRLEMVRSWQVLPDFASVNFAEEGAEELCALLLERGIGVEAGLASVEDAGRLSASGLASRCLRVLLEPEVVTPIGQVTSAEPAAAIALADAMIAVLDHHAIAAPCLLHGAENATWPVFRHAVALGYDTRIGLEDTLRLPDGRLASDNAELVAATVALARELGSQTP